jgi:ubiquitin C-terminal hydrolase
MDKPIDARQFVSLLQGLPQFQGMTLRRQNDAQEFLAKLVEVLALETSSSSSSNGKMPRALTSAECLDADKVPLEVFMDRAWYDAHRNVADSPLTNMMHGQLLYETICGHCQKRFPSSDVFLTLGIDVHDGDDGTYAMQRTSLASCITSLFKSERIEGASWKCDACKQTPDFCTRVCRIWRAPETLLICIKRFDAHTYHGKTRGELSLPKRIDFSQVVNTASPHLLHQIESSARPALYELRAVICHHGSARYGHYDALCRDSVDRSSWFAYDDESVQSIAADRIDDHGGAYILAYAKRAAACPRPHRALDATRDMAASAVRRTEN